MAEGAVKITVTRADGEVETIFAQTAAGLQVLLETKDLDLSPVDRPGRLAPYWK